MLVSPAESLALLGFTLGLALCAFLTAIVLRKRNRATTEWLLLGALVCAGVWHACNAYPRLRALLSYKDAEGLLASSALPGVGTVALALAVALLVHLGLKWAEMNQLLAAPPYIVAVAGWFAGSGLQGLFQLWVAAALLWSSAACVAAVRARSQRHERRFLFGFSAALLLAPAVARLAGSDSSVVVFAALAAPAVFAYYVYRYNLFGLLVGQQIVFALKLGAFFAVYVMLVRAVAWYVAENYGLDERLVEIVLILAAAMIWLPLYGWMIRFFSKRTKIYADFSKRLIEEAARILDLRKRLQFIAEEVGKTFAARRVLLATTGDASVRGEYGIFPTVEVHNWFDEVTQVIHRTKADVYHKDLSGSPEMRNLLAGFGFTYLFPLWYEGALTGLLLLDTSPRLFLDENEAILLGLSRQISHSIETCRVIEEKIGLERALVRQEHMASLGRVAATIAHEIKNPLSSVKTLAQLMREDPGVRERYDRDLGYMIGETDRLNRSVLQLLNFSRPVAEERQDVDLTGLLETMAEMLERQYAGERTRIERRIAPGLRLPGSSTELIKQVVLNLALNAVQATDSEGSVRLEAGPHIEGRVVVSVSDSGPGIPAELREKIFEPFFTTKQRGTGLGLAIVRKNVRHLGGEIVIDSPISEGRGTRISVILPAE